MISRILFVLFVLFMNGNIFANQIITTDTTKNFFPVTGNRALLIDIGPIFSYIGNMFNGSDYNNLNLNSASLLYRKYRDENTVIRYKVNFSVSTDEFLSQQSESFPGILFNGTRRENMISLALAKGNEKHFNYKKLGLYYGSEIFIGGSLNSSNYKYDFQDGDVFKNGFNYFTDRRISDNNRYSLFAGVAGIMGVDYHFSKRFFVNAEIRIPLTVVYEIQTSEKYEDIEVLQPSNVLSVKQQEKKDPIHLFDFSISTNQIIVFRAGVVF
jgi:hypothetical protein